MKRDWKLRFIDKFGLSVDKGIPYPLEVMSFIKLLLSEQETEWKQNIRAIFEHVNWYNEHCIAEHTVAEQIIIQNLQSDLLNMFGHLLDENPPKYTAPKTKLVAEKK